jgi:hypothetical protein
MPYLALYGATKTYLVALSRAVAWEVAGTGVTVSALLPGPVDTGFFAHNMHADRQRTGKIPGLSPDVVARIAIEGYLAGQAVITPGMLGWLCRLGLKLLPSLGAAGDSVEHNATLSLCRAGGPTGASTGHRGSSSHRLRQRLGGPRRPGRIWCSRHCGSSPAGRHPASRKAPPCRSDPPRPSPSPRSSGARGSTRSFPAGPNPPRTLRRPAAPPSSPASRTRSRPAHTLPRELPLRAPALFSPL